jgi:type II secretory pathway component PulK
VEELAWVRGFEASPLIPHLSRWLTVRPVESGINLNTAQLEVLLAMGFARDNALNIIAARQAMPLRNFQEIGQTGVIPALGQGAQMSFRSSPFFTITSTGMVKKDSSRQSIRATVRVDPNQRVPWVIISWYSGFPG